MSVSSRKSSKDSKKSEESKDSKPERTEISDADKALIEELRGKIKRVSKYILLLATPDRSHNSIVHQLFIENCY